MNTTISLLTGSALVNEVQPLHVGAMRAKKTMQNPLAAPLRILVAGGAGFLGSHLCRRLLNDGHEVFCLDNFQTGTLRNLSAFIESPRFTIIRHDVVNPVRLDVRFDEIYNLACSASPIHYKTDPVHTLRTCVDGTFHLLELGKHCGARVLQASSSEVYGDPHVHPQPEAYRGNVNPVGIRSCYDEGNRCAETLCSDYSRRKRVIVKIARIFHTYGPYMLPDDGRLVPNFVMQALTGRDLTVYGDGTQIRALCYVDDMVEGLLRLMHSPSAFHGPVNLGNPQEISVIDVARRVRSLTGANVSFAFRPAPVDDPAQCSPDIYLARRYLKWVPRVSLDDGLRSTIQYFEGLVKFPNKNRNRQIPQGAG